MKKSILILFCVTICCAAANAETGFWRNLGFGVSSFPEEDGNITEGYLSYRFNSIFHPRIRIKAVNSSLTGTVPAADKSLKLTRDTTTELFAYPLGLDFTSMANFSLYVTGGLYMSLQGTRVVGFMDFSASSGGVVGLNSYDDTIDTTFYGPVLEAGAEYRWPLIVINMQTIVVPYFMYTSHQKIIVEPLVSVVGENNYSGSGFPYISIKLKPSVLDFFAPDLKYEYQKLAYQDLSPNSTGNGWNAVERFTGIHSLIVRANFRLPLFETGYGEIGYGRKFVWNVPENDTSSFEQKGTFNLTFSFEK